MKTHFALILAAEIIFAHNLAWATLGERVESVQSDRSALLSVTAQKSEAREKFTVHTIESESTTVQEFVSSTGIVFAVTWKGLRHPDLTSLLGSYAGEYQQSLKQNPRKKGQRNLALRSDHLVIEKWGHMRRLQGRAYDPALIPAGVSIDEIK